MQMEKLFFNQFLRQLHAVVREALADASSCHDYDHTLRVLRNAEQLAAKLPEADLQIVQCAALLHDIARPEEIADKGRHCHAARGAAMVPEFLSEFALPAGFVEAVADAVRTHRYRSGLRPKTLEAAIVFDADKLDSLGATGIGRSFLFAGREGARLHNTASEALNAPEYSIEDTAYREYLVKLRNLADAMLTAPGKASAQSRAAFMDEFFRQMNDECGMNMEDENDEA